MAPPTTHTHDDDTRAAPAARPSQASDLKLSNYLGLLRDDPYDASALEGLAELARTRDAARLGEDPVRLLELARQTHEARGEAIAVARLLEVEAQLVVDDQGFEASLWKELGRVRAEQLLDPEAALAAYERAHELRADDAEVEDAIKRLKQAESSWGKTVKRFVEEAEATEDLSLKSSLYGWYFAQEYGSIYFQNIQEAKPEHLTMVPFQVLRQHWLMAKYFPANKLQVLLQNLTIEKHQCQWISLLHLGYLV